MALGEEIIWFLKMQKEIGLNKMALGEEIIWFLKMQKRDRSK
jgi:hypothetical protein